MFSTLSAVEKYLNSLINYESRLPLGGRDWPKLEPTQSAATRLGLPFHLPNCIHIAGTKGKGSTATFLEELLSPHRRTLSFTSPHLVSFTERVRLGGRTLEERTWCQGIEEIVRSLAEPPSIRLTYFEMTFVFYLWAARQLQTEAHVVEAGLGGRWDATNVLNDTLALLTLVDYDHMEVLGKTLTAIARDKAGVIKPHSTVVVSRQPDEALAVYRSVIENASATGYYFGTDFGWIDETDDRFAYYDSDTSIDALLLAASGVHQRDNAAAAVRAARLVLPSLSADQIRERLVHCIVPGRQQLLEGSPDVLVDVAHNPASFAALAHTLQRNFPRRRILAVTGLMRDKDAIGCYSHLRGLVDRIIVVPLNSPRSHPPDELQENLRGLGFDAVACTTGSDAFRLLHEDREHSLGLLVGSFYLAGDYLSWRQHAGIA